MIEVNGAVKCLVCGKETTDNTDKKQIDKPWLFEHGKSGNPAGRPKGTFSLKTIMRNKLEQMSPDGKRSAAEMFVENLIQDGLDGQDKARDLILTYLEPKPATDLNVNTANSMSLPDYLIKEENE